MAKKASCVFILGFLALFSPLISFCHEIDISYDIDPFYIYKTPAPFLLIDPTVPSGIAASINDRTFRHQYYPPMGFTLAYNFAVTQNILVLFGYSYAIAKSKKNVMREGSIVRLLRLDNFQSHC